MRYLSLVDENNRLKARNSELRLEFFGLLNSMSRVDIGSIKETAAQLSRNQSAFTYNQVLTGMDEIAINEAGVEGLEQMERLEVAFFSCLVTIARNVMSELKQNRMIAKSFTLEEALDTSDPFSDPPKAPSMSLSSTITKLFPPSLSDRLLHHIHQQVLLEMFLTPTDLHLSYQQWKQDQSYYTHLISELTSTSHATFCGKIRTIMDAFVQLFADLSTTEDGFSDKIVFENCLEDGNRIKTEPADSSIYEENTDNVSSILTSRSKPLSHKKTRGSQDSQNLQKSSSLSPRKVLAKLKLLDKFPEVDEEEEEVSLLNLERQALRIRNKTSANVAGRQVLPRLAVVTGQQSPRYDDVRLIRMNMAKLRLQGEVHLELESQGKRRIKRMQPNFSLQNKQKRTPTGHPDWQKSMYFPLLQYSIKRQVKDMLRPADS